MITIHLQPSRLMAVWLLLVHVLAVTGLYWVDLPLPVQFLLFLLLLLSLARQLYRHNCAQTDGFVSALTLGQEHCHLQLSREELQASLLPGSFSVPHLQILRFSREGTDPGRRGRFRTSRVSITVLVLPDSASAADRRELRRFLAGWSPDQA